MTVCFKILSRAGEKDIVKNLTPSNKRQKNIYIFMEIS